MLVSPGLLSLSRAHAVGEVPAQAVSEHLPFVLGIRGSLLSLDFRFYIIFSFRRQASASSIAYRDSGMPT